MKIVVDVEWKVYNNEQEFLTDYPKPKYGHYRPQPYHIPVEYPCIVKELCTVHNSNSHDDVMLCIEYNFSE